MNQKNTHDVDKNVLALMEGHELLYPPIPSTIKARRVCRYLLRINNGADRTKMYSELIQIGGKTFTQDFS
jgi:hypothetical protein